MAKISIAADLEVNKDVEVYSASWCVVGDLDPRCVTIRRNLNSFINDLLNLGFTTVNCYFHNLKYDGSFIINYIRTRTNLKDRYDKKRNELRNGEYNYLISGSGQFFNICFKYNNVLVCFIDSFKIIPYSLKKIGEEFKTKYRKLEMEHELYRNETTELTEEEQAYIKNDVLILSEVMDYFLNVVKLKEETIAGCAMHDFIKTLGSKEEFERLFPPDVGSQTGVRTFLTHERYSIAELTGGKATTIDEFCRLAYQGGYEYLNEEKKGKVINGGVILDRNSMHVAEMATQPMPYGDPYLFFGAPSAKEQNFNSFYFINIDVALELKKDKLPFLRCDNFLFSNQDYLKSTHIVYGDKNEYEEYEKVNITITKPELVLMFENYDIKELDYNFGLCFPAKVGIFTKYINKWYNVKKKSEGAKRGVSKLMLCSLYGRFGQKIYDKRKIIDQDCKEMNKFKSVDVEKKPVFVAVAAATTAYTRCLIVRKAQLNIEHWIYSATDSLDFDCPISMLKGLDIDQKELGAWKVEETFDFAIYVKNKVYMTISTNDNIDIKIKAAGLSQEGRKKVVEKILNGEMTIKDFKSGLVIENGRMMNKQVPGGISLFAADWKIR